MSASKKSKQANVTAEELKQQMFQAMQSTGVLHKVKSQLRQNMINELRGKHKKPHNETTSDLLAATIRHHRSKPWVKQAIDNLVLLHIKQSGYQYSLSLFQQEAGLENYQPAVTNELLSRLGIKSEDLEINDVSQSSNDSDLPESTSTPVQVPVKDEPLLWKLLERLSNLAVRKVLVSDEKENIQEKTEPDTKPPSLSEKLRAIDEEMSHSSWRRKHKDPNITVSTLASAIRRAEEDAERRWKITFEQWKMNELSKMRVDESRKAKQSVEVRLKQLEAEYQLRRNELASREKSAVDRLNMHRETIERESHEQRQTLLRELDQLKTRDDILREKEKFLEEMESIKLRELELLKTSRAEGIVSQAADENEKEEEEESVISKLADSLRQSQDGKHVITHDEVSEIVQEMEEKSKEIEQLKCEVTVLKEKLADKASEKVDAEHRMLREELEQLRRNIRSLRESKVKPGEHSGEEEVEKWKTEVRLLKRDRDEQNDKQRRLEEMLLQMQKSLDDSKRAPHSSDQSQAIRWAQPAFRPMGNARAYHAANQNASNQDSLREYEPLDMRISVSENNIMDEISTAHLRIGVRNRLKYLEEESDALKEEYDRYVRKNYKQTPQVANKTSAEKAEPRRPHFLKKEPEISLPSRLVFSSEPSDLRPAFLRSTSPRDRASHQANRGSSGTRPTPGTPEKVAAGLVDDVRPPTISNSHSTQPKGQTHSRNQRFDLPAVSRDLTSARIVKSPAGLKNPAHAQFEADRTVGGSTVRDTPPSKDVVVAGDLTEDSTLDGNEPDADYIENVERGPIGTLPSTLGRSHAGHPHLNQDQPPPDGLLGSRKRRHVIAGDVSRRVEAVGQESDGVIGRLGALDDSGPFASPDRIAPQQGLGPRSGARMGQQGRMSATDEIVGENPKSDRLDASTLSETPKANVTSASAEEDSLKLSVGDLDDLLSRDLSPKTKSSASSGDAKIDTVRKISAPATVEESAKLSENNQEPVLPKPSPRTAEATAFPSGEARPTEGLLPPLAAPRGRLPPIGRQAGEASLSGRPATGKDVEESLSDLSDKRGTTQTPVREGGESEGDLSSVSFGSTTSDMGEAGAPQRPPAVSEQSLGHSDRVAGSAAPSRGKAASASSSVSEVEERFDNTMSDESVDGSSFQIDLRPSVADSAEQVRGRIAASGKNESEKIPGLLSSLTSTQSNESKPPGQEAAESKQVPLLSSFDDDEIEAALKWGEKNEPRLDDSDSGSDARPQVRAAELVTRTAGQPRPPEEEGDVFQQSASQISMESESSRRSKASEKDFSW